LVHRHWDGIAAYCKPENKVSFGFVKGSNNEIRIIQRRAYGPRDGEYLRRKTLRACCQRSKTAQNHSHKSAKSLMKTGTKRSGAHPEVTIERFELNSGPFGEEYLGTILFLCPTQRDYREIVALPGPNRYRFLFHDYASIALEELVTEEPPPEVRIADPEAEIERITSQYGRANIDGVVSTDDYPGSTLASIISQRFSLPGVPIAADLLCQHKFYGREAQRKVVPDAVLDFEATDPEAPVVTLPFPFFIKPIKSFFSVGAYRVDSRETLPALARRAALPKPFFEPFAILLKKYGRRDPGTGSLLVETLLEGWQASLEGYVYHGDLHVVGVVDAIYFPHSTSFQRFEYPSRLPHAIQDRMVAMAKKVMPGIGFDDGLFNIEFIYNAAADTVHIVEINPRMASQFADLFEKVDGTNTYSLLLDLALGNKPVLTRRAGKYAMAASCVLRVFDNRRVIKLPTRDDIDAVQTWQPDIRIEILATEGRKLSQELQDGHSYRYGLLNIGGRDTREILDIFEAAQRRLPFVFAKT
jgi:hypothetical protein